jgi:tRNA dimethylallyltransferase
MLSKKNNPSKTLIVLLGPTAVGKTRFGISLAKKLCTEIISADSRQFYKELKIGSAPPSDIELSEIKHHFIGHLSIEDYYNVARYETDALRCIENIFLKNEFAIMVGGSGLYIDAVCKGIDELPDLDESLREKLNLQLKNEGVESLRLQLKLLDPEFYSKTDISNSKRLIRALEVCLLTGKKYSEMRKNQNKIRNFNIIKIGLNREREELNTIINNRVDIMIEAGLVDEARQLFQFRDLNALNTVGYKELFSFFDAEISLEKAIENIKTNTRRFAKRQMTWFRKDENIKWFQADSEIIIQDLLKFL